MFKVFGCWIVKNVVVLFFFRITATFSYWWLLDVIVCLWPVKNVSLIVIRETSCSESSGHVSLVRQSVQAEAEEQHLLLLLPVQLWEVSVNAPVASKPSLVVSAYSGQNPPPLKKKIKKKYKHSWLLRNSHHMKSVYNSADSLVISDLGVL